MISHTQLNTSQNILDEEDFLSNYADDFLFDDITTSDEQQQNFTNETEQNTTNNNNNTSKMNSDLTVLLKQAKGRDDQFETVFPPSLLCHPYKYDLKVIGELDKNQQAKLTLNLVDAETLTVPNVTLPNKKIVEGVSVEQIEEVGPNERIIRFTFNLCSFHFKRRPFKLELTQVTGTTSKRLFLSNSFQTFARRRDHHQSFNSAKSTSDKHIAQSNVPLTPDSSSNSSNSTAMQSPKMEKKGAKRSISSVATTYYPLNKARNVAPSSPNSSMGSPTILNPHFAAQFPIVYPNIATAVYHSDMAQQFALQYAPKMQMPLFVPPQWAAYPTNPMVFGSPNTSPVSPPSNAIPHQEKSTDILGTLITGDCTDKKAKKEQKLIHHTPLNFVHAIPTAPVMETSERASIAIQFLQSLTPVERQTVSMFMNGPQAL